MVVCLAVCHITMTVVLPGVKGLTAFLPYRLFILSSMHSFVTWQLVGLGVFDLILQQCMVRMCMSLDQVFRFAPAVFVQPFPGHHALLTTAVLLAAAVFTNEHSC